MNELPNQPVRVGVVGAGDFGRQHAATLSGLAEARVVALVEPDAQRLEVVRGALGDVPGWSSLEPAVKQCEAEAWVVASSTTSHVEITRTILETGKPVLIEKPLAPTAAEARALEPLVYDDSSNLMTGHVTLFGSEFVQLFKEVRQRDGLRFIDAVRHRPTFIVDSYPGESPFKLDMVHDLYLIQVLSDGREPTTIHARNSARSDGSIDLALAELVWEDGSIARLTASFLTPGGMSEEGFDRFEVFGTGWAARMEPNPRPLTLWDDQRACWPMTFDIRAEGGPPNGMLAEELRCFCRVVRGEQAVPFGTRYQDAMQVMHWLDRLDG